MHQCPNVSWVNMGRISVNLLLVLEPEQVLLEPPESDSSSRKRETDLYISCHILSYLIISCHIFSYLNVTYRNISYHIVSYRVISCRILSCLIISYLIISDHIFISLYTQTGILQLSTVTWMRIKMLVASSGPKWISFPDIKQLLHQQ